jgi:hypothetical protein
MADRAHAGAEAAQCLASAGRATGGRLATAWIRSCPGRQAVRRQMCGRRAPRPAVAPAAAARRAATRSRRGGNSVASPTLATMAMICWTLMAPSRSACAASSANLQQVAGRSWRTPSRMVSSRVRLAAGHRRAAPGSWCRPRVSRPVQGTVDGLVDGCGSCRKWLKSRVVDRCAAQHRVGGRSTSMGGAGPCICLPHCHRKPWRISGRMRERHQIRDGSGVHDATCRGAGVGVGGRRTGTAPLAAVPDDKLRPRSGGFGQALPLGGAELDQLAAQASNSVARS